MEKFIFMNSMEINLNLLILLHPIKKVSLLIVYYLEKEIYFVQLVWKQLYGIFLLILNKKFNLKKYIYLS
jgi:hypothetical protein